MRIKPVVDVSVKAVRAVKPGACSKKNAADKPIRPVVAVGSAVIWSIVEVAVRADGCRSDVHANLNLRLAGRREAKKANPENCESKHTDFEHDSPFTLSEFRIDD
jgi:hypothetical protein